MDQKLLQVQEQSLLGMRTGVTLSLSPFRRELPSSPRSSVLTLAALSSSPAILDERTHPNLRQACSDDALTRYPSASHPAFTV